MSASSTPEPQPGAHRTWWHAAATTLSRALDLVFPPTCVSCHRIVEVTTESTETGHTHFLCESCRRRIVIVGEPHCTTCGHPFFGEMAENIGCAHCETLHPQFGAGRTATLLQGPMRDLVLAFKYHRAMHVLTDLATIARGNAHFQAFLAGARLVPVPLHSRKLRERGFNQARLLAEALAAQVEGATVDPILVRIVDTPTQTRLDREQRRVNLKNAFALAPRRQLEPAQRYVLVDDVFTTGATLNACATVLRRAGVTRLDVATLGHG